MSHGMGIFIAQELCGSKPLVESKRESPEWDRGDNKGLRGQIRLSLVSKLDARNTEQDHYDGTREMQCGYAAMECDSLQRSNRLASSKRNINSQPCHS